MRRASPRNHLKDTLLTKFKNKIKLSNLLFGVKIYMIQ